MTCLGSYVLAEKITADRDQEVVLSCFEHIPYISCVFPYQSFPCVFVCWSVILTLWLSVLKSRIADQHAFSAKQYWTATWSNLIVFSCEAFYQPYSQRVNIENSFACCRRKLSHPQASIGWHLHWALFVCEWHRSTETCSLCAWVLMIIYATYC